MYVGILINIDYGEHKYYVNCINKFCIWIKNQSKFLKIKYMDILNTSKEGGLFLFKCEISVNVLMTRTNGR